MSHGSENRRRVERLVFVYAADSGRLSAFIDSARKLLMVKGCSLCAITHGIAGERSQWRECREEIGVPIDFFHRDDMPAPVAAAAGGRLPCVLADTGDELVPLLLPEAIERLRGSVADFKGRLVAHAAMRQLELPAAPQAAAPGTR